MAEENRTGSELATDCRFEGAMSWNIAHGLSFISDRPREGDRPPLNRPACGRALLGMDSAEGPSAMSIKPLRAALPDDEVTAIDLDLHLAQNVAATLRAGRFPTDSTFDRLLPHDLRRLSGEHWTPLAAVVRAAQWLDELGVRTVVDIGSGAGKFCVAAALAGRCRLIGVEHRARLVASARELARALRVDERVEFAHRVFGQDPLPAADAYYVYNPFGENVFGSEHPFGEDVDVSEARYARDVAALEDMLQSAPAGTYFLTYNGFGGRVPYTYERVRIDRELPSVLCLWRQIGRLHVPGRELRAGALAS
jgi:predicted RNA methylase